MDLCNQSTVRRILEENGLAPKKAFGQNFLINPMIPENIAEASAYEPFFYEENYSEDACALEITSSYFFSSSEMRGSSSSRS